MKEIKLEKDNKFCLDDKFNNNVIISLKDKGYYITTKTSESGPYLKIFTDSYKVFNNDTIIYGYKGDGITIFRNGMYGLEEIDHVDTTTELVKAINKHTKNITIEDFKHCELLGKVHVYKLSNNPESIWKKEDGFTRTLITNTYRYIYKTPENQVFAVNPDNIKEYSKYKKYDSFEELKFGVKKNGYDYGYDQQNSKVNNRYISEFVNKLIKNKLSTLDILSTLKELKELIGIDNYRTLSTPIHSQFTHHNDIDLIEVYNKLKYNDFSCTKKYCHEFTENSKTSHYLVGSKTKIQYVTEKEIEEIIPKLDTFIQYGELNLECDNKKILKLYPNNEETMKALNSTTLYNWRNIHKLYKDNPEILTNILALQQYKIRECLLKEHTPNDD